MIFAWMNARVDVDIEREKKRGEKETNGEILFYGAQTEKLVSRSVSVSSSRALSLSLSLYNLPCLPLC